VRDHRDGEASSLEWEKRWSALELHLLGVVTQKSQGVVSKRMSRQGGVWVLKLSSSKKGSGYSLSESRVLRITHRGVGLERGGIRGTA